MKFKQYLFPYSEVSYNSRIIIYGAGATGRQFVEQIKLLNYCECIFIADRAFESIRQLDGIKVCSPNEIARCAFDKIVVASKVYGDEIYHILLGMNVPASKIVNKVIELVHDVKYRSPAPAAENINMWDAYYESAEKDAQIQFDTHFKPILSEYEDIRLQNVIDFACGRGRMANVFSQLSKNLTCCDVNPTAIDFCKKRFADRTDCSFEFIISEADDVFLKPLRVAEETYTFLYSWDAMVHFSYKWLDFYIKEFYRILSSNSYAVIHHSNFGMSMESSQNWTDNPGWRTSVTYQDVAFIAQNHGFTVLKQKVFDWGEPNLDCISIMKKIKSITES
ncbi:MAG: class I SAM-dependent methyltransferase [Clostridiales Family XIII bacterium]|nr:class I SAM-dependent methyltransferase [Clostridiales Family XIII bacterium]